ncbi:hypothetical protein HK096_003525 [Nowakowskiella sp. JEL0078]|nr:hypothetical protein HK096_003525 [Nowakowskiella sp. JEL0078]
MSFKFQHPPKITSIGQLPGTSIFAIQASKINNESIGGNDFDAMDIDDEILLDQISNQISTLRSDARFGGESMGSHAIEEIMRDILPVSESVLIVPDTNYFISHLSFLKNLIKNLPVPEMLIILPFRVLQELDSLKYRSSLAITAKASIDLIQRAMVHDINFVSNYKSSAESFILDIARIRNFQITTKRMSELKACRQNLISHESKPESAVITSFCSEIPQIPASYLIQTIPRSSNREINIKNINSEILLNPSKQRVCNLQISGQQPTYNNNLIFYDQMDLQTEVRTQLQDEDMIMTTGDIIRERTRNGMKRNSNFTHVINTP